MQNIMEAENFIQGVYIYGTGLAAEIGCKALRRLSINCKGFIDANEEKWGTFLCEREIKGLHQISCEEQILIMANPEYKIHERLQLAGHDKWVYVDPGILNAYEEGYFTQVHDCLKANSQKIHDVYNMLGDEKSRTVFEYVLMHRMSHRLDLIEKIYNKNQYFGNELIKRARGSIVDCGAYIGDTYRRFLRQLEDDSEYQYYAFEAEKRNYEILANYFEDIPNAQAYNIAVWDKRENVYFEDENKIIGGSGRVIGEEDSAIRVTADSLDNVIGNKKIDMITMDIEGAEIKALNGAKNMIKNWHPCLAVSAYHKLEHLWEIPILIKEMNSNYQIYFRHHCWNMDDTVCYGIVEK